MNRLIFLFPTWELTGVTTVNLLLAEGLAQRGWQCRAIGTGLDQMPPPAGMLPGGLEYAPLFHQPLPRTIAGHRRPAIYLARRLVRRRLWKKLRQAAPAMLIPGFDLNWPMSEGKWPIGVTVLGIVHAVDSWWLANAETLGSHERYLVAVSPPVAEAMAGIFGPRGWTIRCIPNGVKCPQSWPRAGTTRKNEPLRLIYAGRLVEEQKKVRRLLSLVESLDRAGVPFVLEMAGEGPLEKELRAGLHRWMVDGRVLWHGRLDSNSLEKRLRAADLTVLLSDYEGMPMALLEAMAWGCPGLVSRQLGNLSGLLCEGVNSWSIDPDDAAAAAQLLNRLLSAPARLREASQAAWRTIAEGAWRWECMLDSYEEVCRELAARPGPGASSQTP